MKQINKTHSLLKPNLIGLLLTLAFFGCNQSNQTTQVNTEKESINKESIEEPSPKIVSSIDEKTDKEKSRLAIINHSGQKFSHYINGQKYLATAATINKGDKLYDLSIKQYGVVKGTLVAVLDNKTISKSLLAVGKINKIADKTYRIHFADKQDLLKQYQQINSMKGVVRVELELDFTPIKSQIFY